MYLQHSDSESESKFIPITMFLVNIPEYSDITEDGEEQNEELNVEVSIKLDSSMLFPARKVSIEYINNGHNNKDLSLKRLAAVKPTLNFEFRYINDKKDFEFRIVRDILRDNNDRKCENTSQTWFQVDTISRTGI
nr:6647_t:CDS:2 [Entrophospora candida]